VTRPSRALIKGVECCFAQDNEALIGQGMSDVMVGAGLLLASPALMGIAFLTEARFFATVRRAFRFCTRTIKDVVRALCFVPLSQLLVLERAIDPNPLLNYDSRILRRKSLKFGGGNSNCLFETAQKLVARLTVLQLKPGSGTVGRLTSMPPSLHQS
jgi:hypothetical protein